jgi:hypothetical protein
MGIHQQLFYNFLFGSFGLKTELLTTTDIFANLRNAIFSSALMYQLLLVGCAIVVGLLIYVLVGSASKLAHDSTLLVSEMHSQDARDKADLHETLMRLAVRTAAIIGWVIYLALFLNAFYPLCLVLLHTSLDRLALSVSSPLGWIYLILAGVLLAVAMHLHITFLRLALLRYRVFGTYES